MLTPLQRFTLVLSRTLIGWHFLYEGYAKLMLPGWTRAGQPVASWSAAGYLNAASGPLAPLFQAVASSRAIGVVDAMVPIGLILVGVSLVAGLFTQLGCAGAIAFLTLFYLSAIPTAGAPQPGAEGTYLLVSKNLIELAAVLVILAFRTGRIAGLDLLRPRVRTPDSGASPTSNVVSAVHENNVLTQRPRSTQRALRTSVSASSAGSAFDCRGLYSSRTGSSLGESRCTIASADR